jgi:hypothetical protein
MHQRPALAIPDERSIPDRVSGWYGGINEPSMQEVPEEIHMASVGVSDRSCRESRRLVLELNDAMVLQSPLIVGAICFCVANTQSSYTHLIVGTVCFCVVNKVTRLWLGLVSAVLYGCSYQQNRSPVLKLNNAIVLRQLYDYAGAV